MPRLARLAPLLAASLLTTAVAAGTASAQTEPAAPPAAPPAATPVPVQGPVIIETPSVVIATDAAPAPAATPPSSAPAPAPADPNAAPHNAEWNEVSHINGQLVPVGQRNDYVYKFRRTNIATNPVGLMLGFYDLSISHALNEHIAIRGDVSYMSPIDSSDSYLDLAVSAPIYLRRTYQGAFVEPGVLIRRHECSDGDYCGGDDSQVGPEVLFGWHWTWDSGLNVAAAFGAGRDLSKHERSDDYYDDGTTVMFNGYFRVGYAF